MARRRKRVALVAFVAAALVAPTATAAPHARRPGQHGRPAAAAPAAPPVANVTQPPADAASDAAYGDPVRALGATSPTCRFALDTGSRRACEISGSPAQPHPLSSYGIDVRVGFSITDPGKTFMSALQSLGAGLWMALLYAVKAVLLLLEWAFSLDLTRQAMPSVSQTLTRLHTQVFGDPWLLLAITITGLWGMWHGMVQRRAVETLGGVAATVAMILVALVIIARPADTVGRAAALANDGGLGVLAAGTTGDAAHPRQALAQALSGVFGQTVRNPWCALEFGSVRYCDESTGDGRFPQTADLWLEYPAQSWQRDRLHTAMKTKHGGFNVFGFAKGVLGLNDNRKLPADITRLVRRDDAAASMQEAGGTFPRLALLGTITVGLLGATALFAYLGLRLLLAAAMTLLLLLIAPAMLLAPALGQSGRATFVAWGHRLIGAILAKFIYAIFLMIVLAAGGVFTSLDLGWFGTWLLLGAFWWGVFIKRHELVSFAAAGAPATRGEGAGQLLSHGYYAWMLGRGARQAAAAVAAPGRRGVSAARTAATERRDAAATARQELAREQLEGHGRRVLAHEYESARHVVGQQDELQRELRAVDRRLQGYDEAVVAAKAKDASLPAPTTEQRSLLDRRRKLRTLLADPTVAEAQQTVRHADRNRALTGDAVAARDLEVYRARRRHQVDSQQSEATEADFVAAGVDLSDYRAASPDRRRELDDHVAAHLARERQLVAAAEGRPTAGPEGAWLDAEQLRQRTAAHRAARREERRRAHAQRGVYRRR